MSETEMLLVGTMLGLAAAFLIYMGYIMVRDEMRSYTDTQVNDAKREVKEYVRENYERDV